MTRDDFPAFRTGMDQTGLAYGKALPVDLVQTYFNDLEAYSLGAVLAAIDKARRTGKFFPRVATLRELCATDSQLLTVTDIPPWVNHDEGVYFCSTCDDTGFVRGLECRGDGLCRIGNCGKPAYPNQPHDFTRCCSCRPTNPFLRRLRELQTQRMARTEA
jgi:hypothetical protein